MASLRERLSAEFQGNSAPLSRRLQLYQCLDEWPQPLSARECDIHGVPLQSALILRLRERGIVMGKNYLTSHFGVDSHPALVVAPGQSGMARLVAEAKEFTCEPYLQGHTQMADRLGLSPVDRVASLFAVLGEWVGDHTALSMMAVDQPPECALRAAVLLAPEAPLERVLAALAKASSEGRSASPAYGSRVDRARAQAVALGVGRNTMADRAHSVIASLAEVRSLAQGAGTPLPGDLVHALRMILAEHDEPTARRGDVDA